MDGPGTPVDPKVGTVTVTRSTKNRQFTPDSPTPSF